MMINGFLLWRERFTFAQLTFSRDLWIKGLTALPFVGALFVVRLAGYMWVISFPLVREQRAKRSGTWVFVPSRPLS